MTCQSRRTAVYPNFLAIWANNGEIRKANLAFTFSYYDSFTVTVWWVLVLVLVLVVVVLLVVVQKSQKPLPGTSKPLPGMAILP